MATTNIDDRRVRKTNRALRNGLAELMVDKNLRNITVRELTDKADIHRSTFYAHYKDIYDLYEQIEYAVVDELNEIIMKNYSQPPSNFYTILINYIVENKQLCHMLFGKNQEGNFLNRLITLFEEKCIETWCSELKNSEVEEELKYNVRYHVQGCLAIISRWVASNFSYPMDKLVKTLGEIDSIMEYHVMKKRWNW